MCEVTKYNFYDLYNELEQTFKNASFISIDCEFSALHVNKENRGSLFDTPSKRYQKIRNNLENSMPLEVGVTAFTFNRDDVYYIARPYKFYIFPSHFGQLDKFFICQSSGFHFLSEYKFDFNKVVYSGIPYLNVEHEQEILKYIKEGTFYEYCRYSMEGIGKDFINEHVTLLSEWYYTNETEKSLCDISGKNVCLIYLLQKDIREKFPENIWTYEENQQLKVKKVTKEEYKDLNKKSLEQSILLNALGFTRIYRLLTALKKPIVGHNFLNDIILLINTFDKTVPTSYNQFKELVNQKFPIVYDTKTMSFELLKYLPDEQKWKRNGLQDLYEYFKNETGRHLVPNSPRIELDTNFRTYTDDKFHDAGWDAYCTGYCFIRIAHFFAAKDHEINKKTTFMSIEHLKAVEKFKNHVNVIRATTSYMNLSGPDPPSLRPPCLIIESTTHKPVDIFKMTELLREYGSVDIKPHSWKGRRAIVAVGNYGSARRILGHFQNNDGFKIITYNPYKHSPVVRAALWGGVLASGSILAWVLHSHFTKSQ